MKKYASVFLLAAAMAAFSCAREGTEGASDAEKIYLDAFMNENYPGAKKTGLGVYILEDTPGDGAYVGDAKYVRVEYTTQDLHGNYGSSTFAQINRQLGTYKATNYYGPAIWYRGEEQDNLRAGIEEVISTMNIGGTRKAIIPGWLFTTERFSTPEEYVKNCSGTTTMYTIRLAEAFDDVEKWEKDSVLNYVSANLPGAQTDTAMAGWYYKRTGEPTSLESFTEDTVLLINYTLYRLDGTMLETTIEKVAKDNGIYSASGSYTTKKITWHSDCTQITMGSDSSTDVVDGFANAFVHMHPGEKGTVVFWSGEGYSTSGYGNTIPPYCPLRFDIEITGD